jgi:copper chaperone CopZ
MKQFLLLIAVVISFSVNAQFKTAALQASGLTCAMCSNAINKSLSKLSFIEKVESDIATSSFMIRFKSDADVDIDQIRKKVEDAGFSIAKLKLVMEFNNVSIDNDKAVIIGSKTLHFVDIQKQVLSGEKTILVVDKNFVPAKEYKRYSTLTKAQSFKTGSLDGKRVYHVTI